MQAAICTAMGGSTTSRSSPEDWAEKKILDACIDTMRAKVSAFAASSGGREDTDLVVNETDTSRDNMGYS